MHRIAFIKNTSTNYTIFGCQMKGTTTLWNVESKFSDKDKKYTGLCELD